MPGCSVARVEADMTPAGQKIKRIAVKARRQAGESLIKPGQLWEWDALGKVRVMALADGYVMLRRPRCIPFVASVNRLLRRLP